MSVEDWRGAKSKGRENTLKGSIHRGAMTEHVIALKGRAKFTRRYVAKT